MTAGDRVIQELRPDFAPYSPTRNVMEVITRRRERGLPNPIDYKALETIGIPAGNISRTLQALKFLGLMEDDGSHTESFERLSQAGEADGKYRELLGEMIRSAYDRVFTIVDPAQDSDIAIQDAFRQFQPEGQRSRMVTFFLGLCEQAGITERRSRIRRTEISKDSKATRPQGRRRQTSQSRVVTEVPAAERQPPTNHQTPSHETEFRLIFAVMQQLPTQRRWTAERRQRWLTAVEATVDLMVEVAPDTSPSQTQNEVK